MALIAKIKALLADSARDLALFTLGINTAFRASDLLDLQRDDLADLPDGSMEVFTKERKTGKLRRVTINRQTADVLRRHLRTSSGTYVFEGQRGQLTVSYFGRLIKQWCEAVGLKGQFATHTLQNVQQRQLRALRREAGDLDVRAEPRVGAHNDALPRLGR